MDTNQIYSIVNAVCQETMGESALVATDTASLVAMGNAVLSSSTNTEAFIDTLVQRIGRTMISYSSQLCRFLQQSKEVSRDCWR